MSLLDIEHLSVWYPAIRGAPPVQAVNDVSFTIESNQVVGVVGESGCGKSTLARALLRLRPIHDGTIRFDGKDITTLNQQQMKPFRRQMQIVFQDPFGALNPRHSVETLLSEPLRIHSVGNRNQQRDRVHELLELVGLSHSILDKLAHEFSGGQRQRLAIARALALAPRFLIADEAVSALDVSVQSQIMNLIADLREQLRLSILFISHDLSVIRHVSDRILVMYLGRVLESGPTESVLENPLHPYTQALISAVPGWQLDTERRVVLTGDLPDPSRPPEGCVFNTRCQFASDLCRKQRPSLRTTGNQNNSQPERQVACFLVTQQEP